jgi:hypothetical protein
VGRSGLARVGLEVDIADGQETAPGGTLWVGQSLDGRATRPDVADGQVLDQVRAWPAPGQRGEGKARKPAIGGDQDGTGVAQMGTQRLPDQAAQFGRRRLKVTSLARFESTPPG